MDNLSNPEVGANTSAAKAGARRDEITRQERHDMVWLRDAVLPDDGPPEDIYRLAVPILCEMTHEDLAAKLGPEYACGVAFGIERGLILANLKPEWSRPSYRSPKFSMVVLWFMHLKFDSRLFSSYSCWACVPP